MNAPRITIHSNGSLGQSYRVELRGVDWALESCIGSDLAAAQAFAEKIARALGIQSVMVEELVGGTGA